MKHKSLQGITAFILAGTILFSDIFSFPSKASWINVDSSQGTVGEENTEAEYQSSIGSETVGEEADGAGQVEREEEFSANENQGDGEEKGEETGEEEKDEETEEGESRDEKPGEETESAGLEEEAGNQESEGEGNEDEALEEGEPEDTESEELGSEETNRCDEEELAETVSENSITESKFISAVSENTIEEEKWGKNVGHTLPVMYSLDGENVSVEFKDGDNNSSVGVYEPAKKYILPKSEQGSQLIESEETEKNRDWTYAMCSALESGIKKKEPGVEASIERDKLTTYLYGADRNTENDQYGNISKDHVEDPGDGTGNVNTAMWAAATGYALTNRDAPDQNYRIENVFIYHGWERKRIKQAIETRGEVVTSIYCLENGFQYNKESTDECKLSYHCNKTWITEYPNHTKEALKEHSITIIGWDDDFSYEWFSNGETDLVKDPSMDKKSYYGAWLIKDAYGYENQHYYWVSYYEDIWFAYENKCFCYSFDIEKENENAHTYQYDGGSGISKGNYATAVNIFPKAEQDEVLKSISFGTLTRDAQYGIQVYLEAEPASDGGQPVLEKPLFQKEMQTEGDGYTQWGYYTIDLEKYKDQYACEPRLRKTKDHREWFAVAVTINGNGQVPCFWVDSATKEGILPVCTPDLDNERQSYVYQNGKWEDLADIEKGSNIRIKAHTEDRFTLTASSENVWLGDSLELSASIGGRAVETTDLHWHSDDEEIIAISEDEQRVDVRKAGTVRITVTSEQYGSDTVEITVKDVTFAESRFLLCSNSVNKKKSRGQIACRFAPEGYQPDHIEYCVKYEEDDAYLWVDRSNGVVTVREAAGSRKNIPVLVKIYDDKENFTEREVYVDCYQTPEKFEIINEKQEIQGDLALKVYEERQLAIRIIEPAEAVSSDLLWRSSNAAVVSVDAKGKLCALKEGTADIIAVSDDDPDNKTQVRVTVGSAISQISFGESYITLEPEESRKIEVKVIPGNADRSELKYTLTDLDGNDMGLYNESLSFDPDTGILTAGHESMKITKCRLYVECDGVRNSCYIKINVPVRKLWLSFSPDSIVTNQRVVTSASDRVYNPIKLYCHLEPETLTAEDVSIFYHSDNPEVAQVTSSGEVIPLKAGSVYLAAETESGLSARAYLNIGSRYAYEELTLFVSDSKIYAGGLIETEPETTVATVLQEDGSAARAEDFEWESSNETIATVDEGGQIRALSAGYVTITATDRLSPANYARKTIRVGIGVGELRATRDVIEVAQYHTVPVSYEVIPENADEKTVTMYADDDEIVWCGDGEIYGREPGRTTIYLETENGVRTAVLVRVMEQETSFIKAELTREDTAIEYITTKGTSMSRAQVKAEAMDGTGHTAGVSQIFDFYSADPEIAQVDEHGYVTGGKEGETSIWVSATDGSKISTLVNVTVKKEKSGIKSVFLNHNTVEMGVGEQVELIAATLPENAAGLHGVTWKTLDASVAHVDSQGLVQTQGYGQTWIVAESMDGLKSAKCEIKVLPIASGITLLKVDSQTLENKWINPQAGYQIAVYGNDGRDYRAYCEFASSNEAVCTVNEAGLVVPANGADTGTCTITAKVKNDPLGRKISFRVKLTDQVQVSTLRLYAKSAAGQKEVSVDAPLYLPLEIGGKITLEGKAFDRNGSIMGKSTLKWSTSDAKVMSVKLLKDGTVQGTIKGSGSCILTCSVHKQQQMSVTVPVYIYARKPVLTQSNVSVNLSKDEAVLLPLQTCVGTEMEEIRLLYIKKGKEYWNSGFQITQDETNAGKYLLEYHAEELKKGNYIVYAKAVIRFDGSETGRILREAYHGQESSIEILEIPVKVSEQLPKIKLKQPVLNVFEKNAEVPLELSVNGEEIDSVELSDGKNTGINKKFKLVKKEGQFWLCALSGEKGNYQAILSVYVKGYDQTNPITMKCTIKTVMNKPKLKAETEKLFVCRGQKEEAAAAFRILNPVTGRFISEGEYYAIDQGGILQGDQVVLSGLDTYGKKTIELSVKNESLWNDTVSLKIPVTIEDEKKMTLETSLNKITLNKKLSGDCACVSVGMKQQNVRITKIEEVAIYNRAGRLTRDITGKITDSGANIIEFHAEDGCEKGKYKVEISATVERRESDALIKTWTCMKTLTLNVEEASPSVKVKLKGNIDLYNREETYMTGTVSVSHVADKVADIVSDRNDFMVSYDEAKEQFVLKLKANQRISKKKQTVILKIKMRNGTQLEKAVTVNLKETGIKWKKQNPEVIYKSMGTQNIMIPFETETSLGADMKITVLSVPKGMHADASHGQLAVSLDHAGIKPGKYKIKTAVWFMDSDQSTPMGSVAVKKEMVVQVK
ncbi:MAG: Ig-like domain-containing protein [Eubacterium sp.]|nr:Ig-like domain-containing protein [Eubacterium sp.]